MTIYSTSPHRSVISTSFSQLHSTLRTRSCEEKHEPNLSHDDSFELPMAACVFLVDDPSPCDELDIHGNNYDDERHGNKSELCHRFPPKRDCRAQNMSLAIQNCVSIPLPALIRDLLLLIKTPLQSIFFHKHHTHHRYAARI